MELEELKAGWSILSERLEKNEILNKRIIKEMITKRTQTAHNRLLGYNVFGLMTVLLGMIGVLVIALFINKPFPFVIIAEVVLLLTAIYEIAIVRIMNKFQLDKQTTLQLSAWTLKYKQIMKWSVRFSYIIFGISLVLNFFLASYQNWSITNIILVESIVVFFFILAYIAYIYIEKKNITTIEQGLEELKELEKED
jgi:MFS family permease